MSRTDQEFVIFTLNWRLPFFYRSNKIDLLFQFIDWSRNEGGRLFAGVVDDIGKNEPETQSLHTRNEALIKSIQVN